jgi:hypothetical protein
LGSSGTGRVKEIRSAALGLAPIRVLHAVLSTPFSAAAELRTRDRAVHQCPCLKSVNSHIASTAQTVLAAPKAGNLEGHREKAERSMVAASEGGRSSFHPPNIRNTGEEMPGVKDIMATAATPLMLRCGGPTEIQAARGSQEAVE